MPGKKNGLGVDLERGLISREIFVSEDVYRQEQEQIFARAWLFVGHESQVPKPGDYFVSGMGEESVILCRDRQDEIHVLLNSCRHRGMKVCRYDEGNTPVFTCPYHGWSYAPDGKLVGVPYFKEAYHGKLDKSKWGLVEVAQMVNYKGAIWATWDPEAPPFLDYLGEMKVYLDILLDSADGREGGSEVISGVQKWLFPGNWKFAAENFIGDLYHGLSHRSADYAGIGPVGQARLHLSGRRVVGKQGARRISASTQGGHGVLYAVYPESPPPYIPRYPDRPEVDDYLRRAHEERVRRQGDLARLIGDPGGMFPNMSFLAETPRTISVWHPRSPTQTEAWRFYLIDRDAPQAIKDLMRHYGPAFAGPAGLTEQDDMENWNYATAASRGTIARRYPYNYEMGLETPDQFPDLPGRVVKGISEQNQRAFYRRWDQLMAGRSWAEIGAGDEP